MVKVRKVKDHFTHQAELNEEEKDHLTLQLNSGFTYKKAI